jgi:hypothetical protein
LPDFSLRAVSVARAISVPNWNTATCSRPTWSL